jgi:outer membrane beta-barrel protein
MSPRPTLAALALAAVVLAPAPRAAAQTKADAFAGRIPPVSGQLFRKTGRLELTASANLSLNDAFFSKLFGGLKLGYHLTEFVSVAAYASGGATGTSGSALVCSSAAGCSDPTETQLRQVPGRIRGIAGVEGAWTPVYGKLNLLAEQVAHFDLSLLAGPDLILLDEVLSKQDAEILAASGGDPASRTAFGGHLGLAARLFLSEGFAVRLEVRDYLYAVEVPNSGAESDVQNQLFTELGVSFFFPTRNRPVR